MKRALRAPARSRGHAPSGRWHREQWDSPLPPPRPETLRLDDPRKGRVTVCGPRIVRKAHPTFLREEYTKARALWRLSGSLCLAPRPLRIDEESGAIELEFLANEGTAKDCYVEYVTRAVPRDHMPLELLYRIGEALAFLHEKCVLDDTEDWRPSETLREDLRRWDLEEHVFEVGSVPLHCDLCLQNVSWTRREGRIVPIFFDPSPEFVLTHHPLTRGPSYVDVGLFLSGLEGRVPLRHYPRIRWSRIRGLRNAFLAGYNSRAAQPVDPDVARAFGYCVARDYLRAKHATKLMQTVAGWALYNGLKGNVPRLVRRF